MKKIIPLLLTGILIFAFLAGCEKQEPKPSVESEYEKYSYSFLNAFDTLTQIVGYTKSEEEFNNYAKKIESRFYELHKLYDKYNDYEGINNIKTINDNAGVKPVEVDDEIIDLILFSKKMYEEVSHKTDIAMGSVLKIWHNYREEGLENPANAKIPPMEDLIKASEHMDLDNVIVDIENRTVYLNDPLMSLDVGSVAKGYATEIAIDEAVRDGFTSGIISAGGNVRTFGKPMDGIRERWGVGIQDPDKFRFSENNLLDTIFINDASVVASGDYERFYMVGDKVLHHLIDPDTLMPGDYFRAVTVVTEDSGEADFLSTTVFLIPYDEGRKLVESMDGVEALWVLKDGTIEATDGMKKIMKSQGATGATPQ